jgi:hypothetical protein
MIGQERSSRFALSLTTTILQTTLFPCLPGYFLFMSYFYIFRLVWIPAVGLSGIGELKKKD